MKTNLKRRISCFLLSCVLSVLAFIPMSTTAYASSTAIRGQSTISQTVYTGPDKDYYVTAGSISSGETVYILGKVKNMDWYHIQYHAGSAGKQKAGYVPANTITNINGGTPHEEIYNGGLRMAVKDFRIYSCDDSAISVDIGSIRAGESVTLLYAYQYVDSSKSYLCAYIEYSTVNGSKRGYVYYPEFTSYIAGTNGVTAVARMKATASVYGMAYVSNTGIDVSDCAIIGTIYANEFVTIIAKNDDLVYVEYNSKTGRKRGFISSGYLDSHAAAGTYYIDLYWTGQTQPISYLNTPKVVYAGPGNHYAGLDTIEVGTKIKFWASFSADPSWEFFVYYTPSGTLSSGWVKV